MEDWLLLQGFYHGLLQKAREQLDATAGGSFLSLTPRKAEILMEKMSKNQGWSQKDTQHCHQSEELPEEVNAISTKMDVLLNWLDQRANYKKDRQAIQDTMNSTPNTSLIVNNLAPTQSRQGWNSQP